MGSEMYCLKEMAYAQVRMYKIYVVVTKGNGSKLGLEYVCAQDQSSFVYMEIVKNICFIYLE